METIPKEKCTKIGFIQKPHGINGEVVLKFQEEFYETLENQPVLMLEIDNLLVPFFMQGDEVRFRSGESAIVKMEWVNTEIQAKALSGKSVFVKSEELVIVDDQMKIHELVGCQLFDQNNTEIGMVTSVDDYSGNLLLSVNYQGKDVLIPFNEDLLIEWNERNQTLVLNIPDGLFDLDD